ncbi:MAG TPA: phosphopantetheine-binding protein [Smithellaceae bacterium]|jgi:acyl carrier protein|nr:acyl carrier protein [Smithella sp.]HNZ11797.1 phosphopantetheine-binding protein [Smithellaceae bacterium]HOG81139.1 phosphopantetheine-binding protein [Smithellaceae bacterium]HOQ42707.1 phosphopantetheine-binding protein [Smithellaceae bacterium]HPL66567.1 phosphopantetheine-binding protein [Smithellaceae bacterium]
MDLEKAYQELNVTSREDLIFKLKELIIRACEVQNVKPEDVPTDVPFIGGPGPLKLDSLDAMEIAMEIRYQFGVELKNASTAAKAMQSFDTLADFIISAPKVKK